MKIIKKIGIAIATLLLILLLAFNVYNFFCIQILGKDLATINGYGVLEVISGSMEPTIHIGDMILVDTKADDYKPDDIITFYDVEGVFVTHRIVSIYDGMMITKGDNNNTEDAPLSVDRIIGKCVMQLSGLGKLTAALKSPFTMVMVLLIGIMICFLVSTDKNGNPVLTEEEIEFQKFREEKRAKEALEKKRKVK